MAWIKYFKGQVVKAYLSPVAKKDKGEGAMVAEILDVDKSNKRLKVYFKKLDRTFYIPFNAVWSNERSLTRQKAIDYYLKNPPKRNKVGISNRL